ncbi:MAG TPA: GNAT family protein, partial [Ilumatobacteraceae bacterium]
KVVLRARHEDDVAVLHAELYEDVMTRSRADSRPWRPLAMGQGSPYAVAEPSAETAVFSVERVSDGELAGEALLWSIDVHNRVAHIGLSLRPAARGCGLGTDVVGVLCAYGFSVLGLHRLQAETLADNRAMQRAAMKSGFVLEGTLRRSAWVDGDFVDEVLLGLLATEWHAT